jgi:Restriction endonuclease fold toxin 9
LPPGFERDVNIPGTRKRMDGYNPETKEIIEIKPNNARKIREGEKQARGYCELCDNSDLGSGHTARPVQTYDPSKYLE